MIARSRPRSAFGDAFLERVDAADQRDSLRKQTNFHANPSEGINLNNWTRRSKNLAKLMEKNEQAEAAARARLTGKEFSAQPAAGQMQQRQVQQMQQRQQRNQSSDLQQQMREQQRQLAQQDQSHAQQQRMMRTRQEPQQYHAYQPQQWQQQNQYPMQQHLQPEQQHAAGGYRRDHMGAQNYNSTTVKAPPGGASSFSFDDGSNSIHPNMQPRRGMGGGMQYQQQAAGGYRVPQQQRPGSASFIFG